MDRTRVILFASVVAAAMVFGGVLGATVLARSTYTPASAALAATSPAPAATSNEATAHEAGESAAQEAAENNGTARPHGPGAGGCNEDPAHEAGESAAREAAENAGGTAAPSTTTPSTTNYKRPPAKLGHVRKGTRVYLEVGGKRTFASAADWPGWSRSGKTPEAALEALASYAPRYAAIPKLARIEFPKDATKFDVVENLAGNATTDF